LRHLTRRQFSATALAGIAEAASAAQVCNIPSLATPYKLERYVLLGSGKSGDFDQFSVDCPFVFRHNGRFYMTYIGFDGIGYQTGLASSPDLIHWSKEGCILRRDPDSPITRYNIAMNWIIRENGLHSPGHLTPVSGEFIGAFHAYPREGYEQGAAIIGLCRSKDLRNWSVGKPVLTPENGAAWEHGGLYKPCLLRYEEKFYLFYNAKNRTNRNWHEQTGVAVSSDLKTWTRYSGNPVIRNGPPGSLDSRFASDPCVLKSGSRWALYYFGLDDRGVARDLVATAPDLFHFTKCNEIMVDVGPPGSIDSTYAHKASLIEHEGILYHFYCAMGRKGRGKEVRGISVARSRPWK
jgi:predicted GH43/DUF377 family glycosyl hydrolase